MASFTKAATQQLLLRTQEEVQNHFCPKLLERKAIYRKAQTAYLRRAELGETIITKLNNGKVVETTNTVKDSTSWIACGKTTMGEQYILTAANFEESYDKKSSKPIQINVDAENAEYLSRLVDEGFQEYSSKRSVYAHEVNNDDMKWLTQIDESENDSSQSTLEYYCHAEEEVDDNNNKAAKTQQQQQAQHEEQEQAAAYFIAPWGESMRVEPGDVLVMQYSEDTAHAINKEVYRIEKNAFSQTYREKSR